MSGLPNSAAGFLRMVREARRDFTAIGAIAPSSQALARALASHALAQPPKGLRILEVGSGTGPVTKLLLPLVHQGAVIDVLEPNPEFARHLRDLAAGYPQTETASAGCVNVHQSTLEDFVASGPYDIVIAGLPLKNFSSELVRELLTKSLELLRPNGSFSAFSYLGSLRLRALIGSQQAIAKQLQVEDVIREFRDKYGAGESIVWGNLPPAEAWSLRAPAER